MSNDFPTIRFQGRLRPSQEDVVQIARRKLAAGRRRLHIVAPPGSGKTVLGLYLWAECVCRPAVVLSPNSAIQAQWAARTDLFDIGPTGADVVSTEPERPALLTSLTYQAVTLPSRGDPDTEAQAIDLWQDRLVASEQAKDPDEALIWIEDLKQHNPDYYEQRLATYRKQVRDVAALAGGALEMLHDSSLQTLQRLKRYNVGLIILDECHHLMGHWGRVLADAHDLLDQPIVVGLTATPPDRDGKRPEDIERYDTFFGQIDYEVPVPAVVKDGFLAPYQDLAYFVRPTAEELAFVANADDQLYAIVEELCRPRSGRAPGSSDSGHVAGVRRLPSDSGGPAANESRRRDDAAAPADNTLGAGWAPSAARHPSDGTTRTSDGDPADGPTITGQPLIDWLLHVLAERRLPVGRMKDWNDFERRDPTFASAARLMLIRRDLALPAGVPEPILEGPLDDVPEMEVLTPVLDRYVRHHLRRSPRADDRELAEQVIGRLRTLGVQITETGCQACASPVGRVMAYSRSKTAALVPILSAESQILGERLRAVVVADYEKTSAVTAEVQHLLDEEAGGAIAAFKRLVRHRETDCLDPILVTGSSVLVDDDLWEKFHAAAEEWLAEKGLVVQLEGGEEAGFHVISGRGRDWCPRVYVALITDLFQRGLTKCLVGTRGLLGEGWDANKVNVLVDLTTVTTSMTVNQLRGRSIRLDPDESQKLADNWDVVCLAPEFSKGLDDYHRFISKHKTLFGITDDGAIEQGVGHVHAAFTELKPEGLEESVNVLNADMLTRVTARGQVREQWRIGQPYSPDPIRAVETDTLGGAGGFPPFKGSRQPWNEASLGLAIGRAVLASLCEVGSLRRQPEIHVGTRAGGYVRMFLEQASEQEMQRFTAALHEALGPLVRPRYVIPRLADTVRETWLSSILPVIIGRYFQRRQRHRVMLHAVPQELARNKDLVAVYQRHWNRHVSPGEALYAYRGAGKELVQEAHRRGQVPRGRIHQKEIFL